MKLANGVRVVGVLAIIIVLPLISLLAVRQGAEVRANAKPSQLLITDSTNHISDYQFISQRGDTISKHRMLGKVCIYQLIADSTLSNDTIMAHSLFELQEAYYGITLSLRILSVNTTPKPNDQEAISHLSQIFSCRELWHILDGDSTNTAGVVNALKGIATTRGNLPMNQYVYITDKRGNIRGYYNPLKKEEFDAMYQDVLYLINN